MGILIKRIVLILILVSNLALSQNLPNDLLNTKFKIDKYLHKIETDKTLNLNELIYECGSCSEYELSRLYDQSSYKLYRILSKTYTSDSKIEYYFYYFNDELIYAKVWKEFLKNGESIDYFKQISYYFDKRNFYNSIEKTNPNELYKIAMNYLKKHYESKI
jgi:hypothetical protein